jgi:hypothetical protein
MIADVIDDTKKIKDVTDVAVICLARMALEKK